ncbi:MAG: pyridoxamine 5'-phosphate oxidase family protein [Coriobacteriales bacterium]|jgi:nitroimidazol reductase NimA-like FMN-containing flavoprotein (pyridoxamine 5'-phosphate oxidase superfamily)|nr:pyridoxamine 5'-phosphate oxidase family protein [Coriobacteriales bacterium]
MRKTDREIHGLAALCAVMQNCDVCYLSLFDEGYPYVLPLNFGVELREEQVVLYFHCAGEGKKLELLAANQHVGFSMSCGHELKTDDLACRYSIAFESVCGNGTLMVVHDAEKLHALTVLMQNYSREHSFEFDPRVVAITTVLKLTVNTLTGKRLAK